jgi:hypothetical protein
MNVPVDLLGGAERHATRVRGFVPWSPQRGTVQVLDQVRAVLAEYADYLPLTIRQIFYRLVGAYDYPKTEPAYQRLGYYLNRARRAEIIEMAAIRDDGGQRLENYGWPSAKNYLDYLRHHAADDFRLDRTEGQSLRLAVMCEAAGMAPQLAQIAGEYDIAVISSGGFESVTEKYRLARDLVGVDLPAEVLHIGDHDPSGAHLLMSLAEDVAAFADRWGGDINFVRLAVTPDQVDALSLPTAPAKPSDNRAFHGETCQAEAIAPDVLAAMLREAIENRIDADAYAAVLEREAVARDQIVRALSRLR